MESQDKDLTTSVDYYLWESWAALNSALHELRNSNSTDNKTSAQDAVSKLKPLVTELEKLSHD